MTKLIERLTKPYQGGCYALIYWEIIAYNKEGDHLPNKCFIEEDHARAYMLAEMKKGHIAWKYKRVCYQVKQVENLKFEDE